MTHGLELNRGYDHVTTGQHCWIKSIENGVARFMLEPSGVWKTLPVEEFARLYKRTPPGGAMHGFVKYDSWRDVMDDARRGTALFYQAPMDPSPTRLHPAPGQPLGYEALARTIKIWPPGSAGRGRQRTADPFTADSGHLDRFRRKPRWEIIVGEPMDEHLEDTRQSTREEAERNTPAGEARRQRENEARRRPYAERQFEGPRSAAGVHKLLRQLEEAGIPPTQEQRDEVQRLMGQSIVLAACNPPSRGQAARSLESAAANQVQRALEEARRKLEGK